MKKNYKVILNFPEDMNEMENDISNTLAKIIYKKFGADISIKIANELKKRLNQ